MKNAGEVPPVAVPPILSSRTWTQVLRLNLNSYHWGFLVGPKVEEKDATQGMRYHVKNPISQGWVYEEAELRNVRTTRNLLVRILIAKVTDEERLAKVFQTFLLCKMIPTGGVATGLRMC